MAYLFRCLALAKHKISKILLIVLLLIFNKFNVLILKFLYIKLNIIIIAILLYILQFKIKKTLNDLIII